MAKGIISGGPRRGQCKSKELGRNVFCNFARDAKRLAAHPIVFRRERFDCREDLFYASSSVYRLLFVCVHRCQAEPSTVIQYRNWIFRCTGCHTPLFFMQPDDEGRIWIRNSICFRRRCFLPRKR